MNQMRHIWKYMLVEPFKWLFYCFFQPTRFRQVCETNSILKRTASMLRLALPLFLCSYPLAIIVQLIGRRVPNIIMTSFFLENLGIASFLLITAFASVLAVVFGILWGIGVGLTGGIAWTLTLSIAGSLVNLYLNNVNTRDSYMTWKGLATQFLSGILISIILGLVGGIIGSISIFISKRGTITGGFAGGIVGGIIAALIEGKMRLIESSHIILLIYLANLLPIVGGVVGGITGSIATSVAEKRGLTGRFVGGILGALAGALVGIFGSITEELLLHISGASIWDWGIVVGGTIVVGSIVGIVGGSLVEVVETGSRTQGIRTGIMILITGILFYVFTSISITDTMELALAITTGILFGIIRPSTVSILLAIVLGLGRLLNPHFLTPAGVSESLIVDFVLVICFIAGYYRLPLYPVSSLSIFITYLASSKYPSRVFDHLRHSALYWDERVFLPLPRLQRVLLIATKQDTEQTLEIVKFIVTQRHHQRVAARTASLEMAIQDLETCKSLNKIAGAFQRQDKFFPSDAELIDPRWLKPLARLYDASRDATSANSPLGWQSRRNALLNMIRNLNEVYPNSAFTDIQLNVRLAQVVETWCSVANHEIEILEQAPEKTMRIGNPYSPGLPLKPEDKLFVGRLDLAQELDAALSRGNRRPTFLLQGERRMGKSSTLKHLPILLGSNYLPIFYDLQAPSFSSSIAAFLGKIAEGIIKVMSDRGLPARRLTYERLQEANQRNEAEVYLFFDRWLEDIERTLEVEERILLLTFDEFEKLGETRRRGGFDLELLLDWFRSIIQNHPRLALLFSGVHSFSDMGTNWASYFVNVQTLKVSFLQFRETYQLIIRPVPDFPSEELFGYHVIQAIMRLTACHPFLVQALCSALIDQMNADKRSQIEQVDVGKAANRVLNNWGNSYFKDQWERSNEYQQVCIVTLNRLGKSDLLTIKQHISLDERTTRNTLETLLERDIILREQNYYQLAVPLFAVWVARNGN